MNYWRELLYLLCIWCIWSGQCFAVNETKSIKDDISEEINSCDYKRFELQLELMKLQTVINHETQLREQKEIFGNLDRNLKIFSTNIERIQENLFDSLKIHNENLKDIIRTESQPQVPVVTPKVDEKILIMIDIKDKFEKHKQILNEIIRTQNDTRQLIKEINMTDHTEALKNRISDNVVSLQKIEEKLNSIKDNSIPKIDKLKFYQNIQHNLNATEEYLKDENQCLTLTNQSYPTSCADFNANYCAINKCFIKIRLYGPEPFFVACDKSVYGGGWTVIQRRINGAVDFNRDWLEYKHGFGDIDAEFFIGLEKLHALTSTLKPVDLLIQLQDFDNVTKYAKYNDFQVGNEAENYKLIKLGSYDGSAGDSFFYYYVGSSFSTKDRDNDDNSRINCAKHFTAPWWYNKCYYSNVNGKYYQHPTKFFNATTQNYGIIWSSFHDYTYSLKSVQMLIRPRKV